MRRHAPFLLLLLAYLAVATLFALYTPAWQAPDEPAHANYIRQLAAGRWPVIEPGDYDQAYQGRVISSRFDPDFSVASFTYEDHQPPLYYLLQVPAYRLSDGDLRILRLVSVALGAGVVALAYAIGRRLFAGLPWLALAVPAFVAFLPQHVAILASVNNDSLAELLIAAMLWLLLDTLPRDEPAQARLVLLGVLLGLGFLTKATTYIMAPVIGLAVMWRYRADWGGAARIGLRVFTPALLLGALWWGRNLVVYEGFDPLASAAHDAVVVGQPRTADWLADFGPRYTLMALARTTFQSFWGQFGWMGLVMPGWFYAGALLLSLGLLGGWLWSVWRARRPALPAVATPVLLLTFLGSFSLFLGYNLSFVQHQGRYLFPALIPIAVVGAVGLSAWVLPLAGRRPLLGWAATAALSFGLLGLDLVALFGYIVPLLATP